MQSFETEVEINAFCIIGTCLTWHLPLHLFDYCSMQELDFPKRASSLIRNTEYSSRRRDRRLEIESTFPARSLG